MTSINFVLNDEKGARCIYCFGYPSVNIDTITTCDNIVVCPICGIDAIIPASYIVSEYQLKWLHRVIFKQYSRI